MKLSEIIKKLNLDEEVEFNINDINNLHGGRRLQIEIPFRDKLQKLKPKFAFRNGKLVLNIAPSNDVMKSIVDEIATEINKKITEQIQSSANYPKIEFISNDAVDSINELIQFLQKGINDIAGVPKDLVIENKSTSSFSPNPFNKFTLITPSISETSSTEKTKTPQEIVNEINTKKECCVEMMIDIARWMKMRQSADNPYPDVMEGKCPSFDVMAVYTFLTNIISMYMSSAEPHTIPSVFRNFGYGVWTTKHIFGGWHIANHRPAYHSISPITKMFANITWHDGEIYATIFNFKCIGETEGIQEIQANTNGYEILFGENLDKLHQLLYNIKYFIHWMEAHLKTKPITDDGLTQNYLQSAYLGLHSYVCPNVFDEKHSTMIPTYLDMHGFR